MVRLEALAQTRVNVLDPKLEVRDLSSLANSSFANFKPKSDSALEIQLQHDILRDQAQFNLIDHFSTHLLDSGSIKTPLKHKVNLQPAATITGFAPDDKTEQKVNDRMPILDVGLISSIL